MVLRAWSQTWNDIGVCASQTEIAKDNQIIKKPIGLWERVERGRRVVLIEHVARTRGWYWQYISSLRQELVTSAYQVLVVCRAQTPKPKNQVSVLFSHFFLCISFLCLSLSLICPLCFVWFQYASWHTCFVLFELFQLLFVLLDLGPIVI